MGDGVVINFYERAKQRGSLPRKFPPNVPDMQFLRDLVCATCRTTVDQHRAVVVLGEVLPAPVVTAIAEALCRHVSDMLNIGIAPTSTGWVVVFETAGAEDPFTFSFTIPARWAICKSPQSRRHTDCAEGAE